MNTSRLRETIDQLLKVEETLGFQAILSQVNDQLAQLANQPQVASIQTAFAESLDRLRLVSQEMRLRFEPAQIKRPDHVAGRVAELKERHVVRVARTRWRANRALRVVSA